jgi:hypothetical protein
MERVQYCISVDANDVVMFVRPNTNDLNLIKERVQYCICVSAIHIFDMSLNCDLFILVVAIL